VADLFRERKAAQEVAEVVGENEHGKPNLIGHILRTR
jgi:hypothetical protein